MGLVSDALQVLGGLDFESNEIDLSEWDAAISDDAEPSTDDVSTTQLMSALADCQGSIMVPRPPQLTVCCWLSTGSVFALPNSEPVVSLELY